MDPVYRKPHSDDASRVVVVGAGIIGVVSALYLQRDGHDVILIDRDVPGEGCSFGNAGLLARSSFVPLADPGTLLSVPMWLIDPDGPLSVRWSYLPKMVPWLYRYIRSGLVEDLDANGEAMRVLTDPSVELYKSLAEAAGCPDMVRESDYLQVYRTKSSFDKAQGDMNTRRKAGFRIDDIDGAKIRQLEPALSSAFGYAHHIHGHGYVVDPGGLVKALAELFHRRGGDIRKATVSDIINEPSGLCTVVAGEEVTCDKIVLAAGAFSARLAAMTGIKIPLETERGYHITCPNPGATISRPVMDGDRKFLATPMAMGLRFAGTVELAGLDAPPNQRRIDMITRHARRMIDGLSTDAAESWMGFRPTLPDSLPMIGASPRHANIIYAFGHQHLGLTCAPKTADLVADLISGRVPNVAMAPYSAMRFDQ